MNPVAILSLISTLCEQLAAAQDRIEELEAQVQKDDDPSVENNGDISVDEKTFARRS